MLLVISCFTLLPLDIDSFKAANVFFYYYKTLNYIFKIKYNSNIQLIFLFKNISKAIISYNFVHYILLI